MGVFYDKTRRLAFNEALMLLIEEYRERGDDSEMLADDLMNAAEEVVRAKCSHWPGQKRCGVCGLNANTGTTG